MLGIELGPPSCSACAQRVEPSLCASFVHFKENWEEETSFPGSPVKEMLFLTRVAGSVPLSTHTCLWRPASSMGPAVA